MPFNIFGYFDNGGSLGVNVAFYCLYWTQYCVNVMIYAFRNRQYRQAYKLIVCVVFQRLRNAMLACLGRENPLDVTVTGDYCTQSGVATATGLPQRLRKHANKSVPGNCCMMNCQGKKSHDNLQKCEVTRL